MDTKTVTKFKLLINLVLMMAGLILLVIGLHFDHSIILCGLLFISFAFVRLMFLAHFINQHHRPYLD